MYRLMAMTKGKSSITAPQRVIRSRREFNSWVVNESIEDYALRYAPASVRQWSIWTVTNTAFSNMSFLAMEAIGATMLLQYGFKNALWAAIVVCSILFVSSWPISYYAAKYNIDIDLLTRGAGFGYIGSTISSLIYASFTFIFFAFEASIMAMALQLALHIPLAIGYLLSALLILPLVVKGIGFINKVQLLSQPILWALLLLPWGYLLSLDAEVLQPLFGFTGQYSHSHEFNPMYFGAACTLLFALITQTGEQADYLRFLPEKKGSAWRWHLAVLLGGPAWILIGFVKLMIGMCLLLLALRYAVPQSELDNPTYLYLIAYQQLIDHPQLALILTLVLVCVAQIKINVTNAYAGSLAWSNFFARLTHSHPGRVVWLVFNVFIALVLMEMGIIHAVERILSLYSHIALAWIGAVLADLVICKPLGLSPKGIEFRRAYLYDINPVGVGALLIASLLSIVAYLGFLGALAQGLSGFIALGLSMLCVPLIAYLSQGKYYLARQPECLDQAQLLQCVVCEHKYRAEDMASCPAYAGVICSLCCALEARCHSLCKPQASWFKQMQSSLYSVLPRVLSRRIGTRLGGYLLMVFALAMVLAMCLSLVYFQEKTLLEQQPLWAEQQLFGLFLKIYIILLLLLSVAAWWLVLNAESRRSAESETRQQTVLLIDEIAAHQVTAQHLEDARTAAERANEAKSRYVVGISHELRTPLNSILGYSQLLQKQSQLDHTQQNMLQVINRSGQHLSALIDGLLDLASIETGKITLHVEDIPLRHFIHQIVEMFAAQLAQTQLKLQLEISEYLPDVVRSDKKLLQQVLINLLGNAVKFTEVGGITVKIDYRFQMAHFSIRDTGCGIAEQDLERIFYPFERGENVQLRAYSGTGLGLPIVKLLVDLLGGELSVNSQLNVGSEFKLKIYLPSKTTVQPTHIHQTLQVSGYYGSPKRIMVVDNEAVDRRLFLQLLSPLGFVLHEADSGVACLREVMLFKPDLILLDINMPQLDGWKTAELLRKNQLSQSAILMISANIYEVDSAQSKREFVDGFLLKPVDLNQLLSKIADLLQLKWFKAGEQQPSTAHISNQSAAIQSKHLTCAPTEDDISRAQRSNIAAVEDFPTAVQQLLEFAEQGYIRGLQQALLNHQQQFAQYQPLWQQLTQAVQQFDMQAIKRILQELQ